MPLIKRKSLLMVLAVAVMLLAAAWLGSGRGTSGMIVLPDNTPANENRMIRGNVSGVEFDRDTVTISGWAADLGSFRPASTVAVFVDGERTWQDAPTIENQDAVRAYVDTNLSRSGFSARIPIENFRGMGARATVQVYAASPDGWRELDYGRRYPFATTIDARGRMRLISNELRLIRAEVEARTEHDKPLENAGTRERQARSPDPIPASMRPTYITPRDAYPILDRGQNSFSDETAKTPVSCDSISKSPSTAVILIFGQSNSTNQGEGLFRPDGHVFNMNFFDGHCFVAADPLLGASGIGGSFGSRLGQGLVKSGLFSNVLLVPIGVGGTYIEDWAPGGIHHRRIMVAIRRLADAGFKITFLLWHQGEGNTGPNSDQKAYRANFLDMLDAIRARGVGAPIFVPLVSICGGDADANTRSAQKALPDTKLGIYPGPDTDTLGLSKRFDGCHFSREGLDQHAAMWLVTLSRFMKSGPAVLTERVTARTIGAGAAEPQVVRAR
jgi:hypothetical protein